MQPQALRERVGRRIQAARLHEGLERRDLAYELQTDPRTVERWENGEVYPQLRNRKALAGRLEELSLDDLQPDLEAEERALVEQLNRIEEGVQEILRRLPAAEPGTEDEDARDLPELEPPGEDEDESGQASGQ